MIWHSQSVENVLLELHTDKDLGISDIVADERLEKYGKNSTSGSSKNVLLGSLKKHLLSVYSICLYIIAFLYLIAGL